jgi:hypothetical protein
LSSALVNFRVKEALRINSSARENMIIPAKIRSKILKVMSRRFTFITLG